MSIFERIGDIIKANVNDLIDKAEDPEKMVKQMIIDMNEQLSKSIQALSKAMAAERMALKTYETSSEKVENWENKAKAALKAGETELAKQAVAEKLKEQENCDKCKAMYDQISAQTAAIKEQVEILKQKLEEAKSRQAMLIARSQMADTSKELAKAASGIGDTSSAFSKFDRMEEKVNQKEAEAQAYVEIAGSDLKKEAEDPYKKLESDQKVEEEMARLMAEMQ